MNWLIGLYHITVSKHENMDDRFLGYTIFVFSTPASNSQFPANKLDSLLDARWRAANRS